MLRISLCNLGPPAEILNRVDLESVLTRNQVNHDNKEDDGMTREGESGQLVQEEEKDTGVLKLDVYKAYWVSVGTCLSPLVLFSLLLMQGISADMVTNVKCTEY